MVLNVASQAPLRLYTTIYFPCVLNGMPYSLLMTFIDLSMEHYHAMPLIFQYLLQQYPLVHQILWVRQYKFILNALLTSINSNESHIFSSAKSSCHVWTKLANTFAKPSLLHLFLLREQLIFLMLKPLLMSLHCLITALIMMIWLYKSSMVFRQYSRPYLCHYTN